uniref:Mitochondrial genome maintenance exonuclease 1 n=1 Tax=Nothoprocta perdicaria TaxID=30464 RepID=A0A8C6YSZ1_NOTPE
MKFLQLLSRRSAGLEMLFQAYLGQNQVPYMCLTTSTCLYSKKKKVNGYEHVDQEKYKSLVYSVTSFKTNTRTPETLFEEDNLLYGPADKHRPPAKNVETKAPKNYLFLQGNLFHTTLESILLSEETPAKGQGEDSAVSGYLSSVQHVLKDISEVKALESAVQHETLQYLGLVDCVAKYRGQLCVIDWKTSEKSKPSLQNTFDNPLQVAAYIGAINHDVNYDFQVSCGLIVVAYKNGTPAHPHFMDPDLCSQYWNKWLLRLEEYKEKN